MKRNNLLFIAIFLLTLSACGGGGSGDGNSQSPPPAQAVDTDNDGTPDSTDTDDDGDGVPDTDDAFPLDATESYDTDNDGIGNNADEDDDGDGVADTEDAFPLDATESADFDGDGIGNNADTDDDNDGTPDSEDAFPFDESESEDSDSDGIGNNADEYDNDAACYAAQDGDGSQCYLTLLRQDDDFLLKSFNGQHIFYSPQLSKILILDGESQHFSSLIDIDENASVKSFMYSNAHQRLYVMFEDGAIQYADEQGSLNSFVELNQSAYEVYSAGNFILAILNYQFYIYDVNGDLKQSYYAYFSNQDFSYKWDDEINAFYLGNYRYLYKIYIDASSGKILRDFSRYLNLDSSSQPVSAPIILTKGESNKTIYKGNVFSGSEMKFVGGWDELVSHAEWNDDQYLTTLSYSAGNTKIDSRDSEFRTFQSQFIEGSPLSLAKTESGFSVVTKKLNYLTVNSYSVNTDADGDGVSQANDAFPMDVAASLDTDGDGYPDEWNEEYAQEDSTTGLSLDAFPQEYDCWLEEHDDGNGNCDFSATVPDFTPDQVVADSSIIYLLSNENERVYRWSSENEAYISSINIDRDQVLQLSTSLNIDVNAETFQLYAGYSDGGIAYVDLNTSPLSVSTLVSLLNVGHSTSAMQMMVLDSYLLVSVSNTQYLIDANGNITDQSYSYVYNSSSKPFAWDSNNQRLLIANSSLYYQNIDIESGTFTTSYNSQGTCSPPMVLKESSDLIFCASGHVINANDFTSVGRISVFSDVVNVGNDEIAVLSGDYLFRFNENNVSTRLESKLLDGEYIKLVRVGDKVFIVSIIEDLLTINEYLPSNDSDNDGVDNIDDAFPNDPAASLDADNDGYPDEWNEGYSSEDSATGLSLDSFPQDSACWLEEHDNGNGVCDFEATIPVYTPDVLFADSSGIVYSYSKENHKVYRWSATSESHLNPIFVGYTDGNQYVAPNIVVYSENHNRLYFAYSSGLITYIDLSNIGSETYFHQFENSISNMISTGNYIAVNPDYPKYISLINANGVVTSKSQYTYSAEHLVWNKTQSQILAFSSNYYMYLLGVDSESGSLSNITSAGFNSGPQYPALISGDGSKILFGNGNVFNADDLSWSVQQDSFHQGVWLQNGQQILAKNLTGGVYRLSRLENDVELESIELSGSVQAVLETTEGVVLVTIQGGQVVYSMFSENNDLDGDGIINSLDAFPNDAAASLDSDGDGFPDSWNNGYSSSDSTTGLDLDSYPSDASCWDSIHDNGIGGCDYAATVGDFTPEVMFMDKDNILYLYDADNGRIHRRSLITNEYLDSIFVGRQSNNEPIYPTHVEYSLSHSRLYLGYSTGQVTYIDLNDIRSEKAFYSVYKKVIGLAAVGKYLLIQNGSSPYMHHVVDVNGSLKDQRSWSRTSTHYAWNSSTNKVYYFDSLNYAYRVYAEGINQTSGAISEPTGSSYNSNVLNGGIHFIKSGSQVLLGSGEIYDSSSMELKGDIGYSLVDAVGTDELLITAYKDGDNWYVNLHEIGTMRLFNTFTYDYSILGLFHNESKAVVVQHDGSDFVFDEIDLSDNDDDGIPAWWETKYGLSDDNSADAVLDDDFDGLTNLEEYTNKTSPANADTDSDGLNDFIEINTHGTSPIKSDSDGDWLSDSEEIILASNPLNADTDNDGFTDGDEVYKYNTDPIDNNSVPQALTSFSEDFEAADLAPFWEMGENNQADWFLADDDSSEGAQSLRSDAILSGSSGSLVKFTALFSQGIMSFDLKTPQYCCSNVQLYVDGSYIKQIRNSGVWTNYEVQLDEGEHTLEWRFYKNSSRGTESSYLDNVQFTGN
ncbi:hypothetical protein KIH87_08670 [Paraneptunicella aestuarii]|uniref:hypothetical protein n=1 Tax=Paraneptunicella aestuarii TaxID=2831148 RepID=UPI001E50C79A|nr:hypothetical protein [Paraneptunicella aestuarii]UAA40389.1 hypothetical protein KIH87_08670 [Paraneptunicella aestuarii]